MALKLVDAKRYVKKLETSIQKLGEKKTKIAKRLIREKTNEMKMLREEGLVGSLCGSLTKYMSKSSVQKSRLLTNSRKMDRYNSYRGVS